MAETLNNDGTVEILQVQNYIRGEFEVTETSIESLNPCTGDLWARIPDSNAAEVDRAVQAAKTAFYSWSALSYQARAKYLYKAAQLIEDRLEEFAVAESRDQGKPVNLARAVDIPRAVLNLRSFAESWTHLLETSNVMPEVGMLNYSTRSPIGVAGLIAPWNLPLYLLTFKVAPALMAGNTVVAKPSEMTTVTAWMLAKVFKEIGLPAGVFNLVCGYGPKAGEAIVVHPDVRIISFTGSTAVGKHIAAAAAPMMKKLSLELGGKNAAIVYDDADLDKVIPTLLRSCFINQGEVCLCTSRVFVQKAIYDQLLERFVAEAKKLVVGDPEDKDTFMGALISKDHMDKVKRYIGYAVEDGGRILCGERVNGLTLPTSGKFDRGFFCLPTVIDGLADDSRCMQDEIFGPVTVFTPFDNEEEVISRANNVQYGLCASVYSKDAGRLHRTAAELEVGTVWANCWLIRSLDMPFGGCKMSGIGREGTRHSLEAYTEEKTIAMKVLS